MIPQSPDSPSPLIPPPSPFYICSEGSYLPSLYEKYTAQSPSKSLALKLFLEKRRKSITISTLQQKTQMINALIASDYKSSLVGCPICMNHIVQAVVTPCGHAFCKLCFYEERMTRSTCYECKRNLTGSEPIYSIALNRIVERGIENSQNYDIKSIYYQNKAYSIEQDNARVVRFRDLEIGQRVEFKNHLGVWVEAEIRRKMVDQIPIKIVVEFLEGENMVVEMVGEDEERVARPGTHIRNRNVISDLRYFVLVGRMRGSEDESDIQEHPPSDQIPEQEEQSGNLRQNPGDGQ